MTVNSTHAAPTKVKLLSKRSDNRRFAVVKAAPCLVLACYRFALFNKDNPEIKIIIKFENKTKPKIKKKYQNGRK